MTSNPPQESGIGAFVPDLVPALLAAIPLGVVVLTLGVFAQPGVFTTVLQEGSISALYLTIVPLFFPTLAALGVYVIMHHSKKWQKDSVPKWAGAVTFLLCQVLVPIPFILLQVALLLAGWALSGGKWKWARVVAAPVALVVVLGLAFAAGASSWESRGGWADIVPRALVGRAINGFERVNLPSQGRSVVIVNRGDAYTTVITTGYPPKVERLESSLINNGEPCELKPGLWQLSPYEMVAHLSVRNYYTRGMPACA